MSVVGIDIGTSYCVLATIQRGAVSIIRNELSERLTPALVGFTEKERLIGEAAHTHIKSNFKNTCRNIKQLLGLTRADEADVDVERQFSLAPLAFADEAEGALAGFDVNYQGKRQIFTATRCLAALLTNLKTTAERAVGSTVRDVVISVPAWYSDRARQAVLDAADIAQLNCLRVMNEHAAVALDYGIYRSSAFDAEKATRVAFVGVGHGSTTVSIVDFTRGHCCVLGVAADKTLGGRDLDRAIMHHFVQQFQQKYGVNPMESPKAVLKLEEAATRIKKILSANGEAPCNIECLIEDYDMSGMLHRQEFEALCEPFKQKLMNVLTEAFRANGLNPEEVHHIEIVGGGCRTPWVQDTISTFFNNRLPLSRTLNMDETVARGCALQAAMLDPRYRVREFNAVDCLFDPVSVAYLSSSGGADHPEFKSSVLFAKGSPLGTKKWLTFNRSSDFDIQLTPGAMGHALCSAVELPAEGRALEWPKRVKICAKLSLHGTTTWEAAQLLVDEQVEEIVKEKRKIGSPTATTTEDAAAAASSPANATEPSRARQSSDAASSASGVPPPADSPATTAKPSECEEGYEMVEVVKKKTKTRRFDCKVISAPRLGYVEPHVKTTLSRLEQEMICSDLNQRLIKETMNDLETYIYKMQSLLSNGLREFASPQELAQATDSLMAAQDWLYDTPDGTREMYEGKMTELQKLCEPAVQRHREFGERGEALQEMQQTIADLRSSESSPDWSHVEPEKMHALSTKVQDAARWLEHTVATLQAQPRCENATVTSAAIRQERELLVNFSKTVLVPPPPPPQQEKKPEDSPQKDVPQTQDTDMQGDTNVSSPEPTTTESSDVPMT